MRGAQGTIFLSIFSAGRGEGGGEEGKEMEERGDKGKTGR